MELKELFAQYGFTVEKPHTCDHTGNPMRAFYAPNDPYHETACYIDTVTGEVEIDVGTCARFVGDPHGTGFIDALVAARTDIAEQNA